eukprot:scaffold96404_cov118-Phaeocystis_antarctica.AAC.5
MEALDAFDFSPTPVAGLLACGRAPKVLYARRSHLASLGACVEPHPRRRAPHAHAHAHVHVHVHDIWAIIVVVCETLKDNYIPISSGRGEDLSVLPKARSARLESLDPRGRGRERPTPRLASPWLLLPGSGCAPHRNSHGRRPQSLSAGIRALAQSFVRSQGCCSHIRCLVWSCECRVSSVLRWKAPETGQVGQSATKRALFYEPHRTSGAGGRPCLPEIWDASSIVSDPDILMHLDAGEGRLVLLLERLRELVALRDGRLGRGEIGSREPAEEPEPVGHDCPLARQLGAVNLIGNEERSRHRSPRLVALLGIRVVLAVEAIILIVLLGEVHEQKEADRDAEGDDVARVHRLHRVDRTVLALEVGENV